MIENFNNNFRELCLNLKIDNRKFILGLSGGIDSMALLSLLKRFIISNKSLFRFGAFSSFEAAFVNLLFPFLSELAILAHHFKVKVIKCLCIICSSTC